MLAGRGFLLDDGSLLELAVSDVRVEGKGVMPDQIVPFRLPYAAGSDPQLDAALELLSGAI